MYRSIEEAGEKPKKVYGVLTDYDLSSWTNSLNPDYTKTSQQRTGTPPYMAQELLRGLSPLHLYRHDVESLFYVMLLVSARHSIGVPEGRKLTRVITRNSGVLPYQKWFNQRDYDTLGSLKYGFLSDRLPIELSPDFEDFRPWLLGIQYLFSEGFKRKPLLGHGALPKWAAAAGDGIESASLQYDDETLGGYVKYATILTSISHLKGELESLVIRDPQYSSSLTSPTSADAA